MTVIRLAVLCVAVGTLVSACAENPEQTSALPLVNIVEPGDTSLGCPQLTQEIGTVTASLAASQESIRSQETALAMTNATRSMMPTPTSAPNAGMLAAIQGLNQTADVLGAQQLAQERDRMVRLEQRREHLTGIYNSRCFAKAKQASGKKKA